MEKIKIAIATPGRFNPMGTFSKNYVEYLPFEKILLFGGFVPFFYAGTSRRHQKLLRYFYTFLALKNQKKIDALIKKRFKKILVKEKIDCVLAEFMNTGAAVREACEELDIPLVSNVLGYEINQTEIVEKNTDLYQKLARYKSVVVPVSKKMVETLRSLGFKDERIIWSPLGARKEFFNITPDYNSKTFVAVGRFTGMKSPQNTVRAFAEVLRKFPDAKLIFAGEGELLEETKHLASTLNIAASIDFCGWISQDEQIEIFKKSAIFVQHSVTTETGDAEGTPVAIIEASAAGLPVVSTLHGGIVDTVKNGDTGFLVEENDVSEMASKMLELLENPQMMKNFGDNAKKFTQENFSMQQHVEKVTEAILLAMRL